MHALTLCSTTRQPIPAIYRSRLTRVHLHFAVSIFRFPARKSPDGDPRRVSLGHFLTAGFPQLEVKAALDDAEEVLGLGVFVGCYAAVEPAY